MNAARPDSTDEARLRRQYQRLILPLAVILAIAGVWIWSYRSIERYLLAGYGGQVNEIVLVQGVFMAGVSRESIGSHDAFTVRRFAEPLGAESLITGRSPLASYIPSYIFSYDGQFIVIPSDFGVETSARIPLGAIAKRQGDSGRLHSAAVLFPIWFFVVPIVLWLVLVIRRIVLVRRAVAEGHCTQCGYDLRASADRCPECGTPIPAKASGA